MKNCHAKRNFLTPGDDLCLTDDTGAINVDFYIDKNNVVTTLTHEGEPVAF